MPTIVFASPKGGVGKSTAAVLLASELASHGGTVTMIDADPDRPLSQWAELPGKPERLTVIDSVSADSIIDVVEAAALQTTFVIVDLEGTASMMAGYDMSRADLVIIPAQGSHLDATEAVKAIKLVKSPGEGLSTQDSICHLVYTYKRGQTPFRAREHLSSSDGSTHILCSTSETRRWI
jgi:chromosome partitioning protein